jgi:general stress protein 26
MNLLKLRPYAITFALAFCISITASVQAQQKPAPRPDRETLIATAREIMQTARYCALISLDVNGRPHARTMDPFPPEKNMVVWFGTNAHSRKIREIRRNRRVTLYYFVREDQAYVAISGRANIITDPKAKLKYWKEEWKEFYPDRENGYALIKVIPQTMEIVSVKKGIIGGNSITWDPPTVTFGNR